MNNTPTKPLTEYTKHGSRFTQHCRTGDLAIFQGKSIEGTSETWEVIHIQSHNGRAYSFTDKDTGKKREGYADPAEFPPSDAQWGTKGFTCLTKEAAVSRFEGEMALGSSRGVKSDSGATCDARNGIPAESLTVRPGLEVGS